MTSRLSTMIALTAAASGWPMLPNSLFSNRGGGGYAPPYCQRKARKRARSTGIHPANPKRR